MATRNFDATLLAKFAAILIAAFACGPAALATPDPGKLKVDPASKQGVILFRAPVLSTTYNIDLRRENGGGWSGFEPVFIHAGPRTGMRWIAIKAKPGRWALTSLGQQLRWNICYWKDVPTFEVRPGQITFVGEWDGETALQRLSAMAVRGGQTVSTGQYFWYWNDDNRPPLSGGADPSLRREAEAFVRSGMPGARLPFADPAFATVQKTKRPATRC
ncbi:MAG TPA: hypothetical protein VE891_01270 [Allosphingosinicella sp.]|nr:hypothetical protein [Allosphingosinicella sp.]